MSQPQPYRAILIDPEAFLDHLESATVLPSFATLLANIAFIYTLVERSGTYYMQTSGGRKVSPDTLCAWLEGTAEPDADTQKALLKAYAADLRPQIAEFRKNGKPLPSFRTPAYTVYRDLPKPPPDLIPAPAVVTPSAGKTESVEPVKTAPEDGKVRLPLVKAKIDLDDI